MNIDIVAARQSPITYKLVNHESTGYIYQTAHEEDDNRDDFHTFFEPPLSVPKTWFAHLQ